MDVTFHGHVAEQYRVDLPIGRDKPTSRWACPKFLNQRRPLFSSNGLSAKKICEYCLVRELGSKERRKYEVVFVVLEARQFFREKRAKSVALNLMGAGQIIGNLDCHFAGAFQLSGKRFDQFRHVSQYRMIETEGQGESGLMARRIHTILTTAAKHHEHATQQYGDVGYIEYSSAQRPRAKAYEINHTASHDAIDKIRRAARKSQTRSDEE